MTLMTENKRIYRAASSIMEEAYERGWVERPSARHHTQAAGRAVAYFQGLTPRQLRVAKDFEKSRPSRESFPPGPDGKDAYVRANRAWARRRNKAVGGVV